MIRFLLHTGYV